jgi:hypothetical protein
MKSELCQKRSDNALRQNAFGAVALNDQCAARMRDTPARAETRATLFCPAPWSVAHHIGVMKRDE